jgi:hypothetical protein
MASATRWNATTPAKAKSFATTMARWLTGSEVFTRMPDVTILLRLRPVPFSSQSEYQVRAEAEALVQSIKQSMGLLRRHL